MPTQFAALPGAYIDTNTLFTYVPLLLAAAASFPLLTQFGTELAGLTITYFGVGWAIWLYYQKKADDRQKVAEEKVTAEKKSEADDTERIRQAAYDRIQKLEVSVTKFIDKEKLDERFSALGKQVGENQGAIKTTHDRGEEVANKLDMRVSSLEANHSQLAGLPSQVQKLNTDHAVLASEVRQLTRSIEVLSDRTDNNFKEVMTAIKEIAYTKGKLEK